MWLLSHLKVRMILFLSMNDPECIYANNAGFQRIRICAYVKDLLITQRPLKCYNSFNVGKSWPLKVGGRMFSK